MIADAEVSVRADMRGDGVRTPVGPDSIGREFSTLTACLAVCAAYSLAGAAGVWLLQQILTPELASVAATIGMPWLAPGLGVAGLIVFGTRAWPGVFAGSCITWGIVQGDAWVMVLLGATAESLSVVLIAWLLKTWDYRASLVRYRDVLVLVGAAAIGRGVTSATDIIGLVGAVWLRTGPNSPLILDEAGVHRSGNLLILSPALFTYGLRWWANTTAGVVLVLPLLAFLTPSAEGKRSGERGERLLWAFGSAAWLIAALALPGTALQLPLLAGALGLVTWAALRFGVALASVGTLVFSMAAAVGFGLQLGTFAGLGGRESIVVAWGFIALLTGSGLFLTGLLSGLERAERQSAASVERYRRSFFANPIPMWAENMETGRILAVNAAAVQAYGYSEADFLQLRSHVLGPSAASLADSEQGTAHQNHSFATTHRTASGRRVEVAVVSVPIDVDGLALRVCIVDVVGEKKDLRLAVLNATDHERQRIGHQIRETAGPILARLGSAIDEVLEAVRRNQIVATDQLGAIERDAVAATTVCRQLSRGASLIQYVAGDLIEALRSLPEDVATDGGPEVLVSIHASAPVRLPLERCEHVYGVARDAVHTAMLRPNVRTVNLAVHVTTDELAVTVEDDGTATAGSHIADLSAMGVRAAAARARLDVKPRDGGGTQVRLECRQTDDLSRPAAPTQPSVTESAALTGRFGADSRPAPEARAIPRVWLHALLLILAYVTAGVCGLWFLRYVHATHVSFAPPLALPWVASGIAVAGLLLGGRRFAPAVFVASVVLWGGVARDPWIAALVEAAGEVLGAMLVVNLLERWGFHRGFDRFRDLVLLVAAAAAGRTVAEAGNIVALNLSIVLTAGAPTLALMLGSVSPPGQILHFTQQELTGLVRSWINGVAGVTLFVPVAVTASAELRRTILRRWREAAVLLLAVGLAASAIAGSAPWEWRLPALALAVVVVALCAVRFGVAVASSATLALSFAAAYGYSVGHGPLAVHSGAEKTEILWGFVGFLAAAGMILTTVIAHFDRTLKDLADLKARFEAFFEAIPIPMLAFSAATERITMVNEAAVRKYGYPRGDFVQMPLPMLVGDSTPARAAVSANGGGTTMPTPSIHRTYSGAKFEAEVSVTPVNVDVDTENLCFVIDVTERNDLRRRLLEASDVERRRLAHDLHDGLGQILTGLSLGIATVRRTIEGGGAPHAAALEFVAEAARGARHTCDQIVSGLSPLEATGGDLLAALQRLPAQFPPDARGRMQVGVETESAVVVPLATREHLYQIARESVNNALKHARAAHIWVRATVTDDFVTIAIGDDGVGFEPGAGGRAGLGLQSLALRSAAIQGRLTVRRRKEGGTEVSCRCLQEQIRLQSVEVDATVRALLP